MYAKGMQGLHGERNPEKGTVIVTNTGAAALSCEDEKNADFEVWKQQPRSVFLGCHLWEWSSYIGTVGPGKVAAVPPNSLACTTVLMTEFLGCRSIFNFSYSW